MNKTQPVRGTKDLFSESYLQHEYIVDIAKRIAKNYGYQGIHTPIFEFKEVFSRSLGETSDVVGKEMYSFADRDGDEITLRPEFTASICRAYISNGYQHLLPLKLFTHGPLFRYERPQKGRQRQFHQINYEFLGPEDPAIDAEMIAMSCCLLKTLKIDSYVKLELNSLGCNETRKNYQLKLVEYFKDLEQKLSDDSKIRLYKNPLRILDSKNANDQELIKNAPKIVDYFTTKAQEFFDQLKEYLDLLQINYSLNSNLVRGLDYYNHTTFEFTTKELGSQGTVLAGGRYNGLIKLLGGDDTCGVGFAAGIERLALLCSMPEILHRPCGIIALTQQQEKEAMKLAQELRQKNLSIHYNPGLKLEKALKNAVKQNCKYVVFIGEDEIKNGYVKLKDLDKREETTVTINELYERVK